MILILTEAGNFSGYGHLSRSAAIFERIQSRCKLLVHIDSDNDASFFGHEVFQWRSKFKELSKYCPKIILIDSYQADIKIFEYLKQISSFVVVLDDYDRLNYNADLIINPAIKGPLYSSTKSSIFRGPEWVIVKKEFVLHKKKLKYGKLKKLTLTLGRNDNIEVFKILISSLISIDIEIKIVTGSTSKKNELDKCFKDIKNNIFGELNSNSLADLFISSDLVISAGGQTLNELAYLNVPFLAIQTGEDQYWNIRGYIDAEITPIHFNSGNMSFAEEIVSFIVSKNFNNFFNDERLEKFKIIDGLGSLRIAKFLDNRITNNE